MRQDATQAAERCIVVSVDSHVGPSVTEHLRPYCESAHLDDFDRFASEMAAHGLLAWRSSEAAKPGQDENMTLGRPRADLGRDQAEQFARSAGIRHADQVDTRFLQRAYEASLVPGLPGNLAL